MTQSQNAAPRLRRRHRPAAGRRALTALLVLLAALLLVAAEAVAGPNTAEGIKLFQHGQYDGASRLLASEIEREPDNGEALVALARVYERTGRWDEMAELLERAVSIESVAGDAQVMQAEHLVKTGKPDEARKLLEKVLKKHPDHLRGLIRLGEVYYLLGKNNEGDRTMNAFAALFNKGKAETAEALTLVGVAMRATSAFQDANYALSEAIETDNRYVEAYLRSGELFLLKYNYRDADRMFRKALEVDPNHPEALVGMARTALESDRAYAEAREYLDKALSINPKFVPAMHVQAELELDDEMVDSALERLEEALAINPNDLHSLSLKAAALAQQRKEKELKAVEKQVLELNPRYAQLYVTMGDAAQRDHRFEDAIALYEKALKVDKGNSGAFIGLAFSYTRIANDEKGYEYIEKAYEADPYNVRIYNLAELYDRTLKRYEWLDGDRIRVRVDRNERELLSLYVPPLLDGAFALMERQYGFTPAKLTVELFNDDTAFAVRVSGLPHAAGLAGVCFGKLVTARSPSGGTLNWAMVLWHELAHVFHLQLSGAQVPRWFTEGLAEWESALARKEWRREHELEIWSSLKQGKLFGVDKLNYAFSHPENFHSIIVAYYQASLVIEYIDRTYGYDVFPKMLRAWGDGKSQVEVFEEVLGVATTDFDKGFATWLEKRLGFPDNFFELDLNGYVINYDTFADAAAANPKDADALADGGLAELFGRLNVDGARSYLDKALAIDGKHPRANYLGGIIALREGNYEKAIEYYERLLDLGIDGYNLRAELGFVYLKLGKLAKAVEHYDRAKAFYPRGEEPYRVLGMHYLESGDKRAARRELEKLADIDEADFSVANLLVTLAIEAGEFDAARRHGELALDINPFDTKIHLELARVGVKQQDWLFAEREYRAHLVVAPGEPFEAYLGLAEVYAELGQPNPARDYIERARILRPNDPAISRIESRLP